MDVDAPQLTRVAWQGPVEMDGKAWPLQNKRFVLVPSGNHRLTTGIAEPAIGIADFNGDVESAAVTKDCVEVSYTNRSRAIAILSSPVSAIEVDGQAVPVSSSVLLPAGQHLVTFHR
jgi:hypothetical protein